VSVKRERGTERKRKRERVSERERDKQCVCGWVGERERGVSRLNFLRQEAKLVIHMYYVYMCFCT
jgi:hypothetical protein